MCDKSIITHAPVHINDFRGVRARCNGARPPRGPRAIPPRGFPSIYTHRQIQQVVQRWLISFLVGSRPRHVTSALRDALFAGTARGTPGRLRHTLPRFLLDVHHMMSKWAETLFIISNFEICLPWWVWGYGWYYYNSYRVKYGSICIYIWYLRTLRTLTGQWHWLANNHWHGQNNPCGQSL